VHSTGQRCGEERERRGSMLAQRCGLSAGSPRCSRAIPVRATSPRLPSKSAGSRIPRTEASRASHQSKSACLRSAPAFWILAAISLYGFEISGNLGGLPVVAEAYSSDSSLSTMSRVRRSQMSEWAVRTRR
jgi:hypothetical protein